MTSNETVSTLIDLLMEKGDIPLTIRGKTKAGGSVTLMCEIPKSEVTFLLTLARGLFLLNRVQEYMVAMTAWYVTMKADDREELNRKMRGFHGVCNLPGKMEGLVVMTVTRDRKTSQLFDIARRKDNSVESVVRNDAYTEDATETRIGGRFTELLPPGEIDGLRKAEQQLRGLIMAMLKDADSHGVTVLIRDPEGEDRG